MNEMSRKALRKSGLAAALMAVLFILILAVQALAPARGLTASYFANDSWSGPPALSRLDSDISFSRTSLSEAAGIPERFSVRWEGSIYVPKSGRCTFSVTSDDGAWLSIDNHPVVDNGGIHPAKTGQNEIELTRGSHRIVVKYFDAGGDALIDVAADKLRFYPKSANTGRYFADITCSILIPLLEAAFAVAALVLLWNVLGMSWAFVRISVVAPVRRRVDIPKIRSAVGRKPVRFVVILAVCGLALWAAVRMTPVHGFQGAYYANPSFDGEPVFRTIDRRIWFQTEDIAKRVGTGDFSSILWEGEIFIPREAPYRFSITSDDGSWIYIDGVLVVDNGGSHAPLRKQNTVTLSPGSHKILIKYFDAGGGALVDFTWKREGGFPLFRRPLFLYPQPAHAGIALADTVLFYLKSLLIAGLVGVAGLLGLLLPGFLSRALNKIEGWEHAAYSRLEGLLAGARRRVKGLAISAGVLFLLVLAGRILSPERGLLGTYFNNESWQEPAKSRSLNRTIQLQKQELFARAGDSEVLSVLWEGYVYIPRTSTYRLSVGSDDGSWVFCDGRLVIDNGGQHGIRTIEKEIELERGNHKILLKYFDGGGDGQVIFRVRETKAPSWRKPRVFFYPKPADPSRYTLDLFATAIRVVAEPPLIVLALLLGLLLMRQLRPRMGLQPVLIIVVFLVLTGLYETEIFRSKSTSVRGCDSYAYLHGADLMARNGFLRTEFADPLVPQLQARFTTAPPADKEIFFLSPHGYYVNDLDKGIVYNVFPPGTSMLLYPFVKWGGRAAAFAVLPVLNLALILLFFIAGSRTVNLSFGLLLAAFTFFNMHVFGNSILIMSDVPSMALLAVSAYALYRQTRSPHRFSPFLAGACFGFAVVVRYSNLVGALPLALLFWARFRQERRGKDILRDLAFFGAGGFLFGFVPLALYTRHLFGTIFRLVYEPLTQSRMSLSNIDTGVHFHLQALVQAFGLPSLILMGIGLASCFVRRQRRMTGLICLSAPAAFFVFYMVQSIHQSRYLMPAYPFLGVLFAFGVLEIAGTIRRSSLLTFVFVVACATYPLVQAEPNFFRGIKDGEALAMSLREKIPPRSVVLCDDLSGSVRLYADIPGYRFLRTDLPTLREILDILQSMNVNVYFFLDCTIAEQHFQKVMAAIPGLKDRTRLETQILGIPLYRVWPDGTQSQK